MIKTLKILFYRRWLRRAGCLLLLFLCLFSCAPFLFNQLPAVRRYRTNRLDYVIGEIEPVFLAGESWRSPVLSPDGKWLAVVRSGRRGAEVGLMETASYKLYTLAVPEAADPRWIDPRHLLAGSTLISLPEMAAWQLYRQPRKTGSLDLFRQAASVVALDGRLAAGSLLVSTDPRLPYMLSVGWQGEALVEHLRGISSRIIPAAGWQPYRDESRSRLYSPDGEYFISGGVYSPAERIFYPQPPGLLTMQHPNSMIFETRTEKMVAVARKYGWGSVVLGWAPDSSGVYLQFVPLRWAFGERPAGQPTYKLLVPGRQPSERKPTPAGAVSGIPAS